MDISKIQQAIDVLLENKTTVTAAIDGFCAAGKTTLAQKLETLYDCNVIHMDDFFLRPEQRTPERLAEAGGNIDYERFYEEVLIPLQTGRPFFYRPYDCKTCRLAEPIAVAPKRLWIIEGSYSQHPRFEDPYDLKIWMDVAPDVRRERILARPAALHRRFFDEWIPMEERYLEAFHIRDRADIAVL